MRATTRLRALWMRTAGQHIVDGKAPAAEEISAALLRRMGAPVPRASTGPRRRSRLRLAVLARQARQARRGGGRAAAR
jgi:hypothetical protein